jgi:large subunit ribosomal protein L4e
MKTKVYTIEGKAGKELALPKFFETKVREDLIQKIVEAKKVWQPYGPKPNAGNSYSASGIMKHHRKVWKSQYGQGRSRIPRKIMSVRGSQFNWVGATVPNTRGGRRAHPPKVLSMVSLPGINKKELKLALMSAISASANEKYLKKKYPSIKEEKISEVPFVIESKIEKLKTKEFLDVLKKILGENIFNIAIKKKTIRAGKGKLRGRKHKSNAGMILVVGEDEKIKTKGFDIKSASKLSVVDLAQGGVGRVVVYTEKAIKDLEDRFSVIKKEVKEENLK